MLPPMERLTAITSSSATFVWHMPWKRKRRGEGFRLRTTASISTLIRPNSKLKSTMVQTEKELHGVACMASGAGFATVAVTRAVSQDGTRNGERRCDKRSIIYATKTHRTL